MIKFISNYKFFRFGVTGLLVNSIGYILYLVTTNFSINPKIAIIYIYVFSTVSGYLGHSFFSFKYNKVSYFSGMKFLFTALMCFLLNYFSIHLFVDILNYNHRLVQLLTIMTIACFSFTLYNWLVFKK